MEEFLKEKIKDVESFLNNDLDHPTKRYYQGKKVAYQDALNSLIKL